VLTVSPLRIAEVARRARTPLLRAGACLSAAELVLPPSTLERRDARTIRRAFLGLLGLTYLAAFRSLRVQVLGLYGARGISPVNELVQAAESIGPKRFHQAPTVFWLGASDRALVRACRIGELSGALLAAGIFPRLNAGLSYALYLSFVTVGREFLSYQWDVLLLESGVYALLLGPSGNHPHRDRAVPVGARVLYRWLLFRLYVDSGLGKAASGDATWCGLTATRYHFETQPLPTPLAPRVHEASRRVHAFLTGATLLGEAILPLAMFGPRPLRLMAFGGLTAIQLSIAATGNYAFFNLLTLALGSFSIVDSDVGRRARSVAREPWWSRVVYGSAAALVLLSTTPLPQQILLRFAPVFIRLREVLGRLHLVNRYGLFTVMTTTRPEIVIEGSADGVSWEPYELPYQVGDPKKALRFVAPHQPRVDWQMWFAALGHRGSWMTRMMIRLLEGAPEVLKLFSRVPSRPAKWIRATMFRYRYADRATRRAGTTWTREPLGLLVPPVGLRAPIEPSKARASPLRGRPA
jgi:lipase maturation factor 1